MQKVIKAANNTISFPDSNSSLIVVPRYVGSDFSNDEINTYKLRRIFDNAQIAIFEKK